MAVRCQLIRVDLYYGVIVWPCHCFCHLFTNFFIFNVIAYMCVCITHKTTILKLSVDFLTLDTTYTLSSIDFKWCVRLGMTETSVCVLYYVCVSITKSFHVVSTFVVNGKSQLYTTNTTMNEWDVVVERHIHIIYKTYQHARNKCMWPMAYLSSKPDDIGSRAYTILVFASMTP